MDHNDYKLEPRMLTDYDWVQLRHKLEDCKFDSMIFKEPVSAAEYLLDVITTGALPIILKRMENK
jgi:hypothetical protein